MSPCFLFSVLVVLLSNGLSDEIKIPDKNLPETQSDIDNGNDIDNMVEVSKDDLIDPDVFRDTLELIASRGFEAEEHKVITEDGYIITLHRIINPFIPRSISNQKPILCIHGLMDTSASFVMNSAGGFASPLITPPSYNNQSNTGNNLGFVLSNHGYDVWLGNPRGSLYNHNERANVDSKSEFWDFSIDEMAKYDIPAFVNKIQTETGSRTVGYIGHSQGTGIMFALLALSAQGGMKNTNYASVDYNAVIRPFIALAPVTHLQWTKSPLIQLARIPGAIKVLNHLGLKSFPPPHELFFNRIIVNTNCRALGSLFCAQTVFLGVGFDEEQFDVKRFRVYGSHSPSPTSIMNLIHFVQIYKSGNFSTFDYGPEMNEIKYGSKINPVYDLKGINNKFIALFSSDNDWCADPKDVDYLRKSLSVELFEDYVVPYHKWNHMDFLWAKEAGKYINREVIKVLERANLN